MAFAANSSASAQFMDTVMLQPTVLSFQPESGIYGTKIFIKISATYDLLAVTTHFSLVFHSHRCPAHAVKDTYDGSGTTYAVSAVVPPFEDTRCPSASVPLSLLIEGADGQTLADIDVGTFTYHDAHVGSGESPAAHEDVTRPLRGSGSPEQRHNNHSPKPDPDHLTDVATNTFPYPAGTHPAAAAAAAVAAATANYDNYAGSNTNSSSGGSGGSHNNHNNDNSSGNNSNSNSSNNMIGAYHRPTYSAEYHHHHRHVPPPLKAPTWSNFPAPLGHHRSPSLGPTSMTRPSLHSLPAPPTADTQLVRTSTLNTANAAGSSLNPYAFYATKAQLKIHGGNLESMGDHNDWSPEEWENRRRIVLFKKSQNGSTLSINFRPVSVNARPPNSICTSCIWWEEENECFITSVDTIALLEQLVTAPNRFTTEEKNRIRRNLEGFKPTTVKRSEAFFRLIMDFSHPKPRNIEKDVKVFRWKNLTQALHKIISKYVSPMQTAAFPPRRFPRASLLAYPPPCSL